MCKIEKLIHHTYVRTSSMDIVSTDMFACAYVHAVCQQQYLQQTFSFFLQCKKTNKNPKHDNVKW